MTRRLLLEKASLSEWNKRRSGLYLLFFGYRLPWIYQFLSPRFISQSMHEGHSRVIQDLEMNEGDIVIHLLDLRVPY